MIATCWNQRSLRRESAGIGRPSRREVLDELDLLGAEAHARDPRMRRPKTPSSARRRRPRPRLARPSRTSAPPSRKRRSGRDRRRRSSPSRRPSRAAGPPPPPRGRPSASASGQPAQPGLPLTRSRALQVVADPQRVGHDGERRVHRRRGREEAAVHHVEVVDLVRLAVRVERRGLRVAPEADRCRSGARRRRAGCAAPRKRLRAKRPSWHSSPCIAHLRCLLHAAFLSFAMQPLVRPPRCSAGRRGRCCRRGRASRGCSDRAGPRR